MLHVCVCVCVPQDEFRGPRRHSFNSLVMRRSTIADISSSSWVRNRQTTQRPVEFLPANDDLQGLRRPNRSRVSRKIFARFVNSVHTTGAL